MSGCLIKFSDSVKNTEVNYFLSGPDRGHFESAADLALFFFIEGE